MPSEKKQSANECIQYDTVFRIFNNKTKLLFRDTYLFGKMSKKNQGGVVKKI